jgi:hypothetical protein
MQQLQGVALASEIVINALHQQRAAVAVMAGTDFFDRHPQRTQNSGVE